MARVLLVTEHVRDRLYQVLLLTKHTRGGHGHGFTGHLAREGQTLPGFYCSPSTRGVDMARVVQIAELVRDRL